MGGYSKVLIISTGFVLLTLLALGSKQGQRHNSKRKGAPPLQVWEGEGGNVLGVASTTVRSSSVTREKIPS